MSKLEHWLWFVVPVFLLPLGCTTTSSMPMKRSEDNRLNANFCKPSKGIPITIKVPTHVDVYIKEKYFFDKNLKIVKLNRRALSVDVQTVETEKVVTVDWKRPLSGTIDYGATIGKDDQYFDAINSSVTDTTITDIVNAAKAVAGVKTAATAKEVTDASELFEDERVVAFQRFDLDSCDVEQQVMAFVDHHVNNCHDCLSLPSQ